MTVSKGKRIYSFPTHSRNSSDVESLQASSTSASDSESLNNDPHAVRRPFIPSVFKNANFEELLILKKNSGKRKQRRYQNRCQLQTLAEEDDYEDGSVIMEPYKGPFTRLLQNETALNLWNAFVEKSEEEQEQFMKTYSHETSTKNEPHKDKIVPKLSAKIKRIFKIKKNLCMDQVKKLEDCVTGFFQSTPNGVFETSPASSFERLLVCTIAYYHQLKAEVLSSKEGVRKIVVRNYNLGEKWTPAEEKLVDFVAYLRNTVHI